MDIAYHPEQLVARRDIVGLDVCGRLITTQALIHQGSLSKKGSEAMVLLEGLS